MSLEKVVNFVRKNTPNEFKESAKLMTLGFVTMVGAVAVCPTINELNIAKVQEDIYPQLREYCAMVLASVGSSEMIYGVVSGSYYALKDSWKIFSR